MSVDYIDQSNGGWMTRDYTMDSADLSRMNVVGQTNRGTPVLDGGDAWTNQYLPSQSTPAGMRTLMGGGYDNYAANGWGRDPQTGAAVPPANFAGATVPAVVGNAAGRQQNVTSQPPMAPTPTGPAMMPPGVATQQTSVNRDTAFGLAQTPLNYSSPQALADSRHDRASFVPGGSALYDKLVSSGAFDPYSSSPSSLLSGLVDPEGKAIPGNSIDPKIANHPAFQTMEKMDMLNGTSNAANFYQNITGRSLDSDRKANSALLAMQATNRLNDAHELQKTTTVAPVDDKDKGIKAGDYVKQVMVPGLMPGTQSLQYVPLTPYESHELLNITPDTTTDPVTGKVTQVLDQYGRPSISPKGGSYAQMATGLGSAADIGWAQKIMDAKNAALTATTGAKAPAGPSDSAVAGRVYRNATTTLSNLAGSVSDVFTGNYTPPTPYETGPVAPSTAITAPISDPRRMVGTTLNPAMAQSYVDAHRPMKSVDPALIQNENYDPRIYAALLGK